MGSLLKFRHHQKDADQRRDEEVAIGLVTEYKVQACTPNLLGEEVMGTRKG